MKIFLIATMVIMLWAMLGARANPANPPVTTTPITPTDRSWACQRDDVRATGVVRLEAICRCRAASALPETADCAAIRRGTYKAGGRK